MKQYRKQIDDNMDSMELGDQVSYATVRDYKESKVSDHRIEIIEPTLVML